MAMDCPTCGRPNADGKDFCDCGEYLRWDPTGVFAAVGVVAATPATPAPAHSTSAPPTPVPTEPVVLVLRLPGAPPGHGPPQLQLAVTTPGLLQGVVRNQTRQVDSYALRIAGLPAEWVEISPPSVDLLPYGSSSDGHESHFHVTITPPRSPQARAGRHSFQLEAVSRATGAVMATAHGALEILPFHELTIDALPEIRSGRRRVRFSATAITTGNAPLEVEFGARDREESLRTSFEPPVLHLESNQQTNARLTVQPRRPHWFGRPRQHTLAVTAQAPGAPPPPHQIVTLRQRAWIPIWLPPLLALLAALAAAFALTRPDTATMPPLRGETFNAAQLATARAGFTQTPEQQTRQAGRRSEIGTILRQEPAAGDEARRDAKLVLVVGVGRETARVPGLTGLDLGQAQTALRQAKLKLGPVEGDAGQGRVVRQDPGQGRAGEDRRGRARLARGARHEVQARAGRRDRDRRSRARPCRWTACGRSRSPTAKGLYVDPPGDGDAFRLNAAAADSDPAWLADRIVFRRLADGAGRLFAVDADAQAEPEPLTPEGEDWRSPATTTATLAAVHDDQALRARHGLEVPRPRRRLPRRLGL